jgi:hypothetical protein
MAKLACTQFWSLVSRKEAMKDERRLLSSGLLRRVVLKKFTDVSDVLAASIIRITSKPRARNQHLHLQPRRWRQFVSPKHCHLPTASFSGCKSVGEWNWLCITHVHLVMTSGFSCAPNTSLCNWQALYLVVATEATELKLCGCMNFSSSAYRIPPHLR